MKKLRAIAGKVDKRLLGGRIGTLLAFRRYIKNEKYPVFKGKREVVLSVSASDLFLMQYSDNDYKHYDHADAAVRYLAVENYYGINDYGFQLYSKMQIRRVGYDTSDQFKKLIQSFEEKGYDDTSFIEVDKRLAINNGSHRTVLAIYHKIDVLNVQMMNHYDKREYKIDWFWQNGFTPQECELIANKSDQIMKKCQRNYICILWPPIQKYFEQITEELALIDDGIGVEKFEDYECLYHELGGIIRAVYSSDDIDEKCLELKKHYIENSTKSVQEKLKIRVIELRIDSPRLRVKPLTGLPQSLETMRIKDIFRARYQRMVYDYHYDVIMHITDNFFQTRDVRMLFSIEKDLTDLFFDLNLFHYAFIKIRDARQHEDFPQNHYFESDIDIITLEEELSQIAFKVGEQIEKKYRPYGLEIKTMRESKEIRIRVEMTGFLILQVHLQTYIQGLSDTFVKDAIENRCFDQEYFYLNEKFEYFIRLVSYLESQTKTWHKRYLFQNRSVYDRGLVDSYIKLRGWKNKARKIGLDWI